MDKTRLQHEPELRESFLSELTTLQHSGAVLPFTLKPSEAWYLFASLQLVLRHPGVDGETRAFLDRFARNIEGRLCNGRPAMAKVAAMGWEAANDEPAGGPAGDQPAPPAHPIEPGVIQQTEKGEVPTEEELHKHKPE